MQHPRKNRPLGFAIVASCVALLIAAAPLAAQQANGTEAQAAASSAAQVLPSTGAAVTTPTAIQPVADASAPLPGPRLSPLWLPVEPNLDVTPPPLVPPPPPPNVIVISTLAIVLIAVIITILVVK